MPKHPSMYRDARNIHRADTCAALVAAVDGAELRLEALTRGTYPGRPLPAGAVPQVKSIGFWDAPYDQRWGLEEHRNEGIEFSLVEFNLTGGSLFTVFFGDYYFSFKEMALAKIFYTIALSKELEDTSVENIIKNKMKQIEKSNLN